MFCICKFLSLGIYWSWHAFGASMGIIGTTKGMLVIKGYWTLFVIAPRLF